MIMFLLVMLNANIVISRVRDEKFRYETLQKMQANVKEMRMQSIQEIMDFNVKEHKKMSLALNRDSTPEVDVKVCKISGKTTVILGNDLEIGNKDFSDLVMYYLTNTDLEMKDSRLELIKNIVKLDLVSGYNQGHIRLGVRTCKKNKS